MGALASKSDREYITVEKGDKDFYYKKLQECRVGFSLNKHMVVGQLQRQMV